MDRIWPEYLQEAETGFKERYEALGTEDRLLIYHLAEIGIQAPIFPDGTRGPGAVKCDVPLTLEDEHGRLWDLIADLHSHHEMGVFWSPTDNASERLRGIVFGVFSWKDDTDTWLFRRWNGQEFEALTIGQVVADG